MTFSFHLLLLSLMTFTPHFTPLPSRPPIDVQGHRGCRGLMPENTLPAFLKALELGVTTLEMDVVITKDHQVVLSHEPFLSHEICLTAEGREITEATEKQYNLYQMTYAELQRCDCGSKPHPRFPNQQKMVVHKPLLSEVIHATEAYCEAHQLPPVQYNIETKSDLAGDGVFHPAPEAFVDLLMEVVGRQGISNRTIIQSFDPRTLQQMHTKYPTIKLALLVENLRSPKRNIRRLGFTPAIYSPNYPLVNTVLMKYARSKGMQVIPWTVNEPTAIRKLLEMPVDGIISDYPDRVLKLLQESRK
jgi:glycerophosphoryl diester phosphodiesterase